MWDSIFWTSLLVFYVIAGFYWVWGFRKGAPFFPSSRKEIKAIMELLQPKPGMKIAELGAGDCRIAVQIAKKGAQVSAIEINPVLTLIGRIRKVINRVPNLEIIQGDIMKQDFSQYDALVIYLFPQIMQDLQTKLYQEMKPGSKIISNTFKFKQRQAAQVLLDGKVLCYNVGE